MCFGDRYAVLYDQYTVAAGLLRYSEEWSMDLCEKTCCSKWRQTDSIQCLFRYIGMRWSRKKDRFDWTILDSYLKLVNKIWVKKWKCSGLVQTAEGMCNGWDVLIKNAVHLRTPDYVLYSPSPSSKENN